MFSAAIHGRAAPRHLSTDHDPLFDAHRWKANLRILEIAELKTVPHVPLSHPFVERLIGRCGENFDQVLFWNARDLERKLADFQVTTTARSHASLKGYTPLTFVRRTVAPADLNNVRWVSHCRDLSSPRRGLTTNSRRTGSRTCRQVCWNRVAAAEGHLSGVCRRNADCGSTCCVGGG
jgi:hypothetical protein